MPAETASKTILIAEDSNVISNLTRKILEQQKYKVLLAKNGGDVLPQLEKNAVDAVLMDINIPIKDGMQCTRDIRAHANASINSLPVIVISGNANDYSMADFQAAGVTAYLPKPLNFDELVRMVRQYVG
ncbi:MAG TPA: response regulator [Hymenobacter sp.]|uniref:response regulator n=1 Tax=Hymenobacter sp. TaxID=1898978 RepID=UPI002D7E4432|nr:response regulator [Hymenobacter sp.]HET9505298.1 response regulator [Hymenobacter sp.]